MKRSSSTLRSVASESSVIRTGTIFLIITIIVAMISVGLVAWQGYYDSQHPHEAAKRNQQVKEKLHRGDNSATDKDDEKDQADNDTTTQTVPVDNSLAVQFDGICADPNQGIDQEMCSDTNRQLRYDIARLATAIKQALVNNSLVLNNGEIILQNRQSTNATINAATTNMSTNIKTATVVNQTDEAMVGNMDFGDVLVETNSKCANDHFSAIKTDDNNLTVTTRFYNTPLYYCQDVK